MRGSALFGALPGATRGGALTLAALTCVACSSAPADQATLGAEVYGAHCASCHDDDSRPELNIDAAGLGEYETAIELFEYTRRTMPYEEPNSLSEPEYWATTAHMLRSAGMIGDETLGPENAGTFKPPVSGGQSTRDDERTAFTDAAFASEITARVDAGETVVVYVWAPHMPLSVDGYSEIARAAESLGLTLIPLLFPQTEREFARREAERVGIPPAGLREVGAAELLSRDVLVHAPALIVFSRDGVSPTLPGYRNAAGYREFLERFPGR